jgi:outer membrane protein OmpA-like peptidoglycan-associated protein
MSLQKYLLPLLLLSSLYGKSEFNEYLIQVSPTATSGIPYENFAKNYVGIGGKLRVWNLEADVNFYEDGKQYHFLNYVQDFVDQKRKWIPYGLGGVTFLDGTWARPVTQVGLGLKHRFTDRVSLFGEAKFTCDIKPDKAYYHFTGGFSINLFPKKRRRIVDPEPEPKPEPKPPKDSDSDGVEDMLDNCPNSLPGIAVDKFGCALDSDSDGVPDYADQCSATEVGVKVDGDGCALPLPVDEVAEVKEIAKDIAIRFENMSREIDSKFKPELNQVADFLNEHKNYRAVIRGYTDALGSPELNQQLSESRADIVKQFFIENGVSEEQLSAEGFGASNYIAPNNTRKGRFLNRRVTVDVEKR